MRIETMIVRLLCIASVVLILLVAPHLSGVLLNRPLDPTTLHVLPYALYLALAASVLVGVPQALCKGTLSGPSRLRIRVAGYQTGAMYGLAATVIGLPVIHLYVFCGITVALVLVDPLLYPNG